MIPRRRLTKNSHSLRRNQARTTMQQIAGPLVSHMPQLDMIPKGAEQSISPTSNDLRQPQLELEESMEGKCESQQRGDHLAQQTADMVTRIEVNFDSEIISPAHYQKSSFTYHQQI